jgi:predicted RNase H-like nuclease
MGGRHGPAPSLPFVRTAGIDGTKGGWVAIVLDEGAFSRDHLVLPVEAELEELADADVIAVDIPIGFGPREADRAARRFLTGNASTVFTTPTRELLETPFRRGLGISKQAHSLGARILHVTELARSDSRLYEVHPEVSFRMMNSGRPLSYRKRWAGGAVERLELLRKHGIELANLGESASAPIDDVLDAAAAAWSAHRIATNAASTLPNPPEVVDGRHVAIWY